jgi:hypothetical protein
LCKKWFYHKHYGIGVPSSLMVFECIKKVHSTWSFLNKNYNRENALVTEEKLDGIGAR